MTGGVHRPGVLAALRYVADHTGCNLLRVAQHAGRVTGRRFDYDPANRALDLGLIEHRPAPCDQNGNYRLYLTQAGWAVLNAVDGLAPLPEGLPDAFTHPPCPP